MQSFERKINSDHNKTIIRLIRRKLYPLQFSKKDYCPPVKRQSLSRASNIQKVQQPSLPSIIVHQPLAKSQSATAIIDKVKEYLAKNKQKTNLSNLRINLDQYIKLFEDTTKQPQKQKSQSLELNIFQFQPLDHSLLNYTKVQPWLSNLTGEQRSRMTGKIRRKLNHKKLINSNKRF